MKKILHIKLFIIIVGIIFTLSPIISNYHEVKVVNGEVINLENVNVKLSEVSGKIHIDNNWTDAKDAGICTGNGTYSEPYVIEDLVIDSEDNITIVGYGKSYAPGPLGNANILFQKYNSTLCRILLRFR